MNLKFKKCGDLYVYFDENKNPLYSFEVDYNRIKKFHLMSEKLPEEIILPKIEISEDDYLKINNSCMLGANDLLKKYKEKKFITSDCREILEKYATGAFKVATGCFAGIKKIKLVAPVNYSIMLDWGCFDYNAEIELVLPKDMTLKQVYRLFDTGFDYERENWTLISHKDFNYESESYCGIRVVDFKPEYARNYKYKISKENIGRGGNQIKQKKNDKKYLHTTFNPELKEYKALDYSQLEDDLGKEL